MNAIYIDIKSSARAALYALDELKKYIRQMSSGVRFCFGPGGLSLEVNPEIFTNLGIHLENAELDDAVHIDVSNCVGVIVGSNPRALLIAVYKFLELNGTAFVKPGPLGDNVPKIKIANLSGKYTHAASYRHRGVCIEGAVSIENVLDIIAWLPKVGMNSYYTQFLTPYIFFQRYYSHDWNSEKSSEQLTRSIIDGFVARIVDAASVRGLSYHAVGHGWTCEPIGIPGLGWYKDTETYPPEVMEMLALVKERRELWHGIPLNTNLCYSNPKVRELVTSAIAKYAADNPGVDVIHFWLADGSNNTCECEECSGVRASDFYVEMLNLLDKKMTAMGLSTRIVFLIYVDLLWKPLLHTLKNGERFILMFAPITRRYDAAMKAGSSGHTTEYVQNNLKFPENVDDSVAYLREWQEVLPPCDSFMFDYHFMWDYIREPGGYAHAHTLFEDMQNLKDLGLNGMISCQNQRVFCPSGLGMYAMAQALWNRSQNFNDVASRFFAAAFGSFKHEVENYLKELSRLFPANVVRGYEPANTEKAKSSFDAALNFLLTSRTHIIEMHVQSAAENTCVRQNLAVLLMHNHLTELNAQLWLAHADGDTMLTNQRFDALVKLANNYEDKMQTEFDMELYLQTIGGGTGCAKHFPVPKLED